MEGRRTGYEGKVKKEMKKRRLCGERGEGQIKRRTCSERQEGQEEEEDMRRK